MPVAGFARVLAIVLLGLAAACPASAAVLASRGDAYVSANQASDAWSIGTRDLEFTIGLDRSGVLTPQRLLDRATGNAWDLSADPDTSLTVGSERIVLSSRAASLTFAGASASTTATGVLLTFVFDLRTPRLRLLRSYAAYPGSPTIETWTRVEAPDVTTPVVLTNLVGWQFSMPAVPLKWVGGLRGYSTVGELEPFEIAEGLPDAGEAFEIGSDRRSTEQYIPFISADDGAESFFGGVMWSGAWRITVERGADRMRLTARFPESPAAEPSRPIDVPHTFFGLTEHSPGSVSSALRQFINGVRGGRPFPRLVTYNTWFAYGTMLTEDQLVTEIDYAAAVGAELFVVDAGWYIGAGRDGLSDFESGLGSLATDPDRFPSGLASLGDYAHGAGMAFGVWVEPERVALDMLNDIGAREGWLATRNGDYEDDTVALVCLASPAARQWLLDRLSRLIEAVRPDYLKWDNNGWTNCNRSGHGHGPDDGNFAHVTGLYDMLDQLRARFPDLLIENVSGGGNRVDFGMLARTDAAWMDDRTSPSSHVRHNLEGLMTALPPDYLLSFVLSGDGEDLNGFNDLSNMMRSRMPGVLGLTYQALTIDWPTLQTMAQEVQFHKFYRRMVTDANASLLSPQAPVPDGWDVIQETAAGGLSAIVFGFKSSAEEGRVLVMPRGLVSDETYTVDSTDAGMLGTATGASLMADGIELVHGEGAPSRAHVLVLTASSHEAPPLRNERRRRSAAAAR